MKRTLAVLFLLTSVCLAEDTRTEPIKLLWDNPGPDAVTNYVFLIHSSTNATTALPWPVMLTITGGLNCVISTEVSPTPKFYYVTAQDLRSCATNLIFESDPSNVAQTSLTRRGGLSIVKGP